jgi:hypothetical protein
MWPKKLQLYYGLGYCNAIYKYTYNSILALEFKCEKWVWLITIWANKVCDHRAQISKSFENIIVQIWGFALAICKAHICTHTHTKEGGNQLHPIIGKRLFVFFCFALSHGDLPNHNTPCGAPWYMVGTWWVG